MKMLNHYDGWATAWSQLWPNPDHVAQNPQGKPSSLATSPAVHNRPAGWTTPENNRYLNEEAVTTWRRIGGGALVALASQPAPGAAQAWCMQQWGGGNNNNEVALSIIGSRAVVAPALVERHQLRMPLRLLRLTRTANQILQLPTED